MTGPAGRPRSDQVLESQPVDARRDRDDDGLVAPSARDVKDSRQDVQEAGQQSDRQDYTRARERDHGIGSPSNSQQLSQHNSGRRSRQSGRSRSSLAAEEARDPEVGMPVQVVPAVAPAPAPAPDQTRTAGDALSHGASVTSDWGEFCRICHESGEKVPLVSACRCTGSMQHVHNVSVRTVQHVHSVSTRTVQHVHSVSTRTVQHVHNVSTQTVQHVHNVSTRTVQHVHSVSTRTVQHVHNVSTRTVQHVHNVSTRTVQHVHSVSTRTVQHVHNVITRTPVLHTCSMMKILDFFSLINLEQNQSKSEPVSILSALADAIYVEYAQNLSLIYRSV